MAKSTAARKKAMSKAGTGNATPGALSKAPSKAPSGGGDRPSVMPSLTQGLSVPKQSSTAPPAAPAVKPSLDTSFENTQSPALKAKIALDAARAAAVKPATPQGLQIPQDKHMGNVPTGIDQGEPVKPERGGVKGAIDKFFELGNKLAPNNPDGSFDTQMAVPGAGAVRTIVRSALAKEIPKYFAKLGLTKIGTAPALGKVSAKGTQTLMATFTKIITASITNSKGQISPTKVGIAVVGLAGMGTYIAGKMISGHATGLRDVQEEAMGMAETLIRDARRDGDFATARELEGIRQQIRDEAVGFGLLGTEGTRDYARYAKLMDDVVDRAYHDEEIAFQTGETEAAKWSRITTDRMAQERAIVDYTVAAWTERDRVKAELEAAQNETFNANRVDTENQILRARSKANDRERAERREQLEQEAAFWEEQARIRAAREAAEREELARFWAEYRKLQAKIQDESSGRSRLSFGLFR